MERAQMTIGDWSLVMPKASSPKDAKIMAHTAEPPHWEKHRSYALKNTFSASHCKRVHQRNKCLSWLLLGYNAEDEGRKTRKAEQLLPLILTV